MLNCFTQTPTLLDLLDQRALRLLPDTQSYFEACDRIDYKFIVFIEQLLHHHGEGFFNPYTTYCAHDHLEDAPARRLARLIRHLSINPKLILIGEALGYQGGRYSGLAFTSEKLLLDGAIPRQDVENKRLTKQPRPFSEPSSNTVWSELYNLRCEESVLLWNAFPYHPFDQKHVLTNRRPTTREICDIGAPILLRLLDLHPGVPIAAIGRQSERVLAHLEIEPVKTLRHPAYGGKSEFVAGLSSLVSQIG